MEKEVLFSFKDENLRIHHTLTSKPSIDNFAFQSHSHNMYEIYLFLSGDGEFVIEGNKVQLERGTIIFTLCGQTHNLLLKSDEIPYERIAIMFGEKYLPCECEPFLLKASKCGCVCTLSNNEIEWFLQSISILQNCGTSSILKSLSVSLINLAMHKIINISYATRSFEETEDDLVKQIIKYIERNLSKDISLDTLAKALYRDKAYLGRRFKEIMGCGIWEYIIRKRIFCAREQLYLTESITDAFSVSGFKDYSAFYRKYKKYVGCSPSEDLKKFVNLQISYL